MLNQHLIACNLITTRTSLTIAGKNVKMENSVVKYEEFDVPKEKNNKTSKVILAVCILCVAVLVLAGIAIGAGVGVSVSQTGRDTERVEVLTLTDGELRGQYFGENGAINFLSSINSSHIYFLVTSDDGRVIIHIVHPLNTSMTLMEVNTVDFLVMDKVSGQGYDEYMVPKNSMDTVMSCMSGRSNMSEEMLAELDTKNVNETRYSTLRNLAMSPEATLIIDAALALGNLGIQGADSNAVMKFYVFAMKLSAARNFEAGSVIQNDLSTKQNQFVRKRRAVQCPSNGATCPSGSCPFRQGSNPCFGMCGPSCTCWDIVCGDCCVHEYCRSHDQCCADRGFFSFECLSVAWRVLGSLCTQTYRC